MSGHPKRLTETQIKTFAEENSTATGANTMTDMDPKAATTAAPAQVQQTADIIASKAADKAAVSVV